MNNELLESLVTSEEWELIQNQIENEELNIEDQKLLYSLLQSYAAKNNLWSTETGTKIKELISELRSTKKPVNNSVPMPTPIIDEPQPQPKIKLKILNQVTIYILIIFLTLIISQTNLSNLLFLFSFCWLILFIIYNLSTN
jgi:hypothetical protein